MTHPINGNPTMSTSTGFDNTNLSFIVVLPLEGSRSHSRANQIETVNRLRPILINREVAESTPVVLPTARRETRPSSPPASNHGLAFHHYINPNNNHTYPRYSPPSKTYRINIGLGPNL